MRRTSLIIVFLEKIFIQKVKSFQCNVLMENGEENIMKLPPTNPDEPLINKRMKKFIVVQSLSLSLASLISFVVSYYGSLCNFSVASTMCFVTLTAGELLRAYGSRHDKKILFKTKLFTNKFLNSCVILSFLFLIAAVYLPLFNKIFSTCYLSFSNFALAILFSFVPIISGEIFKLVCTTND